VSSITDNGTGDYTVNFTTAMPDANYATQVTWGMIASTVTIILGSVSVVAAATGSRRFSLNAPNGAGTDMAEINVSIFR
jgi:TPP-dependent 2-oxoacid decarboxylase